MRILCAVGVAILGLGVAGYFFYQSYEESRRRAYEAASIDYDWARLRDMLPKAHDFTNPDVEATRRQLGPKYGADNLSLQALYFRVDDIRMGLRISSETAARNRTYGIFAGLLGLAVAGIIVFAREKTTPAQPTASVQKPKVAV